jgi:hypothetical protein
MLWNQLLKLYDFFSQARRTCGTTNFIRPCTILHATGFGLPPYFEDCHGEDTLHLDEMMKMISTFYYINMLSWIFIVLTHKNMAAGKCTCADMSRHPNTLFHFRVRGFVARSDQTKDYLVGICCFATEQVILGNDHLTWRGGGVMVFF